MRQPREQPPEQDSDGCNDDNTVMTVEPSVANCNHMQAMVVTGELVKKFLLLFTFML